jgi:ATP-dependent helicase/nuclease subunit B
MQRADVLILSGLNEDTWPPTAPASPWMSRPMMKRFGLQLPERRIGLSAHDFVQGFCASQVYLTRSLRQEGSPTQPCRWLLRLETALAATGCEWPASNAATAARWLDWQERLDEGANSRPVITAPRACPPLAARPRRLSVTKVETWMRDPYAIYAEYVLRLKALQPIDADPGAADFGSAVHRALDAFVREAPAAETADQALDRLLACGRSAFAEQLDHPVVRGLGWPRFEQMARWFVAAESERRAQFGIRASRTEIEGRLELDAPAGPFRLTAKADRIDLLSDGSLAIVDYKTGTVPKPKEVSAGYAPQLPLEAAIAAKGGFAGLAAAEVSVLEYIRLRGNASGGERIQPKADARELADAALQRLEQLIALFDDGNTAYEARPRAAVAPRFSDYEHLERLAEWASVMEDDA